MRANYTLDRIILDFGDIGPTPATLEGSVEESGLFGPGRGFLNAKIEKVTAYVGKSRVPADVTADLSKAARTDLEERLEAHHVYNRNYEEGA